MITRKRFRPPNLTGDANRDLAALGKAISDYLLSIEDRGSLTITEATIDSSPIGGTTPAAGAFTTLSATGQITSTVATGTAPLVIASTTKVDNLHVARATLADTASVSGALTGHVTTSGTVASLGSFTSANLSTALTDETGSGAAVFATSPTLVTPALGTPASGVLTNCTGLPTAGLVDDAVTFAKIQNITTDRLLGRDTALTGDVEELTVGGGIEFTGTGIQRSALTGDVTAAAGGNATTIANDAVTYAKIQNVSATDKVLGRSTAGAGDVEEIACTAAGRALIDDADAATQRTTLGLGSLATVSNLTGPITSVGAATAVAAQTGTGSTFVMSVSPAITTSLGIGIAPSYTVHGYNTSDAQVGYFHLAKNNGGSGVGFTILDDRGFSGVNSGTSFEVVANNTGSTDTGAIANFRTTGGDSTDIKIGIKKGINITQTHTETTSGGEGHYRFNNITCTDSNMNSDPATGINGYFKTALRIEHYTAGTAGTPSGGVNSLEVYQSLDARTTTDNPNRNYCAAFFSGLATVNDNGAAGSYKGAVYGINPVGSLGASATFFHNVTGGEFNTNCVTGSSVSYKTLIQLTGQATDKVNGADYDGMIGLGGITGAVGWKTGILFSAAHGQQPLATDGYILRTMGASTIGNGIDLSSYTISTNAWKSTGITIAGSGLTSIDFASSANNALFVRNTSTTANSTAITAECSGTGAIAIAALEGANQQFLVTGAADNAVHIRVNSALKKIEVGAVDSGGVGYRMLRVTN